MSQYQAIDRVIDLLDPAKNVLFNATTDQARALLAEGDVEAVRRIDGHFALVATARRQRPHGPLHRPAAALLHRQAHRGAGPDRRRPHRRHLPLSQARRSGRPVPSLLHAHGAGPLRHRGGPRRLPRSEPDLQPLLHPPRNALPADLDGHRRGLHRRPAATKSPSGCADRATDGPIGVCFSGGIDSGSVFLVAYHAMLRLGMNPARLKAFTLAVDGGGDDLDQARRFLEAVGLGLVPGADRGRRARPSTGARRCASSRTTSRSTCSRRRWPWPCAAASGDAIPNGAT